MAATFKASFDAYGIIGEDVTDRMVLVAARETPFLNLLVAPSRPATSIYHQWTEESIGPDRLVASTAVNSATAATGIQINGYGNQLQVGMILEMESSAGLSELLQITSVPGANSILVSRNFGARNTNSLVAGGTLFVISTAALEGSETTGDVTQPRLRYGNYTQIFKKPVIVTGTDQAVMTAPDVGSEFEHQKTLRSIELMRDLEKAVFRGVASGNSIGSATAYRTMDGLRARLTSINSTIVANSFATAPVAYLNALLQSAWTNGARDIDVVACGKTWKKDLSGANTSRVEVGYDDSRRVVEQVATVETDFGAVRLVLTPWLPDASLMGISTQRVSVVPLRGRFFQATDLAKTGDSFKGHVLGEYTLEVHRQDAMFQASV